MQKNDILDNRYRIIEKLGEGGMGVVYKAYDQELGKEVAIKLLKPEALSDDKATDQFKKEVRLSQELRHDNITATYDFKRSEEFPYLVMEYVEGQILTNYIYKQPNHQLDEGTFLKIASQILDGVEHAHKKGIIHRDLKSSNIMITDNGQVKIMDFGIAASLRETYSRSTGRPITISIHFASPEQINGEPPSVSMDIYSLGCVFYEMLTGDPPFTQGDILHQQLTKQPEPIQDALEHLNSVIFKCLEKRKEDRFKSIEELKKVLGKHQIIKHDEKPKITIKLKNITKKKKRKMTKGIFIGFVVIISLVLSLSYYLYKKREKADMDAWNYAVKVRTMEIEKIKEKEKKADMDAWNYAVKVGTINSYQNYIKNYPEGKYSSDARIKTKEIEKIKEKEKKASELISTVSEAIKLSNLNKAENLLSELSEIMPGNSEIQNLKMRLAEARRRIEELAEPRAGQVWREPVTGMEFVWVPEGEFQMGSAGGDNDEKPVHRVYVDGFWMGRHEVTQGQWTKIMSSNPSHFQSGDNYPVERVNWGDAQNFIVRLNNRTGKSFRLPTESEWEYACRAGTTGERYGRVDDIAWYNVNSGGQTHPVGQKLPNAWGFYDMLGNVWEWCQDWYGEYNPGYVRNPTGSALVSSRVYRGGSWHSAAQHVRSADRVGYPPSVRGANLGFRLAKDK